MVAERARRKFLSVATKRAPGKPPAGERPAPYFISKVTQQVPEYKIIAKVDQVVTKEVKLSVTASSEEEAEVKAREALSVFPAPVLVEGVNRMQTCKSHYWIPKSIDFVKIKEERK